MKSELYITCLAGNKQIPAILFLSSDAFKLMLYQFQFVVFLQDDRISCGAMPSNVAGIGAIRPCTCYKRGSRKFGQRGSNSDNYFGGGGGG